MPNIVKIIQDVNEKRLEIFCINISIMKNQEKVLDGPGVIKQNINGDFTFKLYIENKDVHSAINIGTTIEDCVDEDGLHTFLAKEPDGLKWMFKSFHLKTSFGNNYAVVLGTFQNLFNTQRNSTDFVNRVDLFILKDPPIPFNSYESVSTIRNGKLSESAGNSTIKVDFDKLKIRGSYYNEYLSISFMFNNSLNSTIKCISIVLRRGQAAVFLLPLFQTKTRSTNATIQAAHP
ncbi:MAG: hypothetical protein IIA61_14105, partial [Candidatus Marinimicrobia bacterium]|nr:hypothetical protein [Candidatus Neomarinimicrobiota bacterium]